MNPAPNRLDAMRPLREDDLQIGQPLAMSVYDQNGALLLLAGFVIENDAQMETLIARGSLVQLPERAPPPPPRPGLKPRATIEAMVPQNDSSSACHDRGPPLCSQLTTPTSAPSRMTAVSRRAPMPSGLKYDSARPAMRGSAGAPSARMRFSLNRASK